MFKYIGLEDEYRFFVGISLLGVFGRYSADPPGYSHDIYAVLYVTIIMKLSPAVVLVPTEHF